MERLTQEEFLFIWEDVLGPDTAWSEYGKQSFWCDIDESDFDDEALLPLD